jgi:hypothetical protein
VAATARRPKDTRVPVAKVCGRVLIDGKPAADDLGLFVVLSDPEHLEKPGPTPRMFAQCDPEGNFAFTLYYTGDGVPYGKYVATFVELHRRSLPGRARAPRPLLYFVEPDELKNLYNDPEKNKNNPAFILDVQPPGRTDYQFNLAVAGKDPVKTPGRYAVTRLQVGF